MTVKLSVKTKLFEFTLLASKLAVKLNDVPVAAPIFGVTNCALFATAILPPIIAVVTLSTLAEITVPVTATPFAPVYATADPNCVKTILVTPISICPGVVNTQLEPPYARPVEIKK